jgi:tRNA A37 threonylcarbamoyladenosine dehydratase
MDNWLERTALLIGENKLDVLKNAHVLVVGLGGVGAYTAEMLCRAGVGQLTIVDADVVHPSNRNRQLIALLSTQGQSKSNILAKRLLDINPELKLTAIREYIRDEKTDDLLSQNFDYVVDAIDTLTPKVNLIRRCIEKGLPLVSSMGAGAKLDPSKIEIADISKSHHCSLAHQLRKRLNRLGIRKGFKVVFSSELSIVEAIQLCDDESNKKSIVGTISYMPPIFGCMCASVVIRGLIHS